MAIQTQAKTWIVAELKAMDATDVLDLIEKRLGRPVPVEFALEFAMDFAVSKSGGHVRVLDPGPGGSSYDESIDWDALAALLNGGER